MNFQPGDRVRSTDSKHIDVRFHNQPGTVVETQDNYIHVNLDNIPKPNDRVNAWSFKADTLVHEDPGPTDEEIAALFGLTKEDR